MSEKLSEQEVCPPLTDLPFSRRVSNVGDVERLSEEKDLIVGGDILLDEYGLVAKFGLPRGDEGRELLKDVETCIMVGHICSKDHLDDDVSDLAVVIRDEMLKDVEVVLAKEHEGLSYMVVFQN